MTPLPEWVTDHGHGRYSIDIKAALAAGETLPIKLYDIPQFADFFTDPPKRAGIIEFMQTKEDYELIPNGCSCPQDVRVLLFYCGEWAVGYLQGDNYFYANDDPYEFPPTAWTFLPPIPA